MRKLLLIAAIALSFSPLVHADYDGYRGYGGGWRGEHHHHFRPHYYQQPPVVYYQQPPVQYYPQPPVLRYQQPPVIYQRPPVYPSANELRLSW